MQAQQTEELTREQIEVQLLERLTQDAAFRETLIRSPQEAWRKEFGTTDFATLSLRVFENTANQRYLIAPSQDESLRRDLSQNPKSVWKRKFGNASLKGYTIRVIEEYPGEFCFVLPTALDAIAGLEVTQEVLEELSRRGIDLKEYTSGLSEGFQSLTQRPTPKTKLGRILLRLQGGLTVLVLSNPVVMSIMRPIYWVRSLIFAWRRL